MIGKGGGGTNVLRSIGEKFGILLKILKIRKGDGVLILQFFYALDIRVPYNWDWYLYF